MKLTSTAHPIPSQHVCEYTITERDRRTADVRPWTSCCWVYTSCHPCVRGWSPTLSCCRSAPSTRPRDAPCRRTRWCCASFRPPCRTGTSCNGGNDTRLTDLCPGLPRCAGVMPNMSLCQVTRSTKFARQVGIIKPNANPNPNRRN